MRDVLPATGHAFDRHLDCIGQRCPLPVLRARKALKAMPPGAVLKVESSDPVAVLDVPAMVRDDGHELIAQQVEGTNAIFFIRRGARPQPA